ncbi:hypothetical protein JAAARDRAFT_199167 [Jaapia argillacea MUCL 33604]|uniref:F-box domain-containing protein n=1 Tax=Jaapia argillacea MUCL 33604 TaxID=933084 RepID=A0A067PJZ3_9AGAM|nr:hypothetical protein JAAARDRAFT_199167 [Jaapia argillacea MUCL 33604]
MVSIGQSRRSTPIYLLFPPPARPKTFEDEEDDFEQSPSIPQPLPPPPDLITLLRSEFPPSPRQAERLVYLLHQATRHITPTKDQSTSIRTNYALLPKRSSYLKTVETNSSLLAPIRMLPPEILVDIFALCDSGSGCVSNLDAPIVFMQVCSSWRKLVLGSPRLWSSPCVVDGGDHLDRSFAHFTNCLEKSADSPLTISAVLYQNFDKRTPKLPDIFSQVVEHASRWRSLKLYVPLHSLGSTLSRIPTGGVPLLRQFMVWDTSPHEGGRNGVPGIGFLKDAPSLRVVHLRAPRQTLDGIELPWNQLTQLLIDCCDEPSPSPSSLDLVTLLRACPNLIHCHLDLQSSTPTVIPTTNLTLTHINLHHLHLRIFHPTPFLPSLTLPNLQTLHIECLHHKSPWDPFSLSSFLSRSRCPLEALTMILSQISTQELIECFSHLRHVVSVQVNAYDTTLDFDPVLASLVVPHTTGSTNPPQCPNLKKIIIFGPHFTPQPFIDFVRSRRYPIANHQGVTRLEIVQAVAPSEVCQYLREELEGCRRDGLKLVLRDL